MPAELCQSGIVQPSLAVPGQAFLIAFFQTMNDGHVARVALTCGGKLVEAAQDRIQVSWQMLPAFPRRLADEAGINQFSQMGLFILQRVGIWRFLVEPCLYLLSQVKTGFG